MTMIEFEEYLYNRVTPILARWDDTGIYAVSFFVYSNESFAYRGCENVSCFEISYNTEENCGAAPAISEERWNYAYWPQDVEGIISPDVKDDEGTKMLFEWYARQGLERIGFEDEEGMYDGNMNYIGKGPVGYYALLMAVSNVARRIQQEGLLAKKFGRSMPILVHDLEYPWYVREATLNANPGGEAADFLAWMESL